MPHFHLKRFIVDNFLEKLKDISSDNHSSQVQVYYFMGTLIFDVIIDILVSDAMKAILSFVLVFVYLRLMIGSWLLASVGMLEIVLSLPLAWSFFSNVLGVKYFSTLNVLCLFIVAAIGADDMFVVSGVRSSIKIFDCRKSQYFISTCHHSSWMHINKALKRKNC